MRVPLFYSFVRCPFENLMSFMDKIKEGLEILKKAVHSYVENNYTDFETFSEQVCKIEQEADHMKREIRNSLPKGVFMPVDKFQFFTLIRELDQILDRAEDIVVWLSFKKGVVLQPIKKEFIALLDTSIQTVDILAEVVHITPRAVGFIKRDRELVKEKIREVRLMEHVSDQIAQSIVKTIFNLEEVDCLALHHLLETTKYIGNIADHAENAADIIRVMIAR